MLARRFEIFAALAALSMALSAGVAQEPLTPAGVEQSSQSTIPNLVRTSGVVTEHRSEKLVVRFSIFATRSAESSLWQEDQLVQTDEKGQFSVLLGAGSAIGLPQALFVSGDPRWLGVSVGNQEESRTLLASVPYALKAGDSNSLGGVPAAGFVTQDELAAKLSASTAVFTRPALLPQAAPTGTGAPGYLPIWTAASTLGNSGLFQTGTGAASRVGIGTTAPATSLDVNGVTTLRARLALSSTAATAAAGVNSPFLEWIASTYSSATAAPVAQNFVWQAQPVGNNTASPSSKLALLFSSGTHFPAATGLSIAPNGVITFAPGQSFPSSSTIFPLGATFDAESTFSGSSADYMLKIVNTNSTTANEALDVQASGTVSGIVASSPAGYAILGKTTTGSGIIGTAVDGIGGSFANNSTGNPTLSASNQSGPVGDLAGASNTVPAFTVNNSSTSGSAVALYSNAATGIAISANSPNGTGLASTAGAGIAGTFNNGSGLYPAVSIKNSLGSGLAVYGTQGYGAYITTSDPYGPAGYFSNLTSGGEALYATAEDGYAGYFNNNSAGTPTIYAVNAAGGSGTLFKTLMATSPGGTCGIGGHGNLTCTGQVKTLVTTESARQVETYSVQSSENWLEDYGAGRLENGRAIIQLDRAFVDAANTGVPYHVFLTPEGDAQPLFIAAKSRGSFEVHEAANGGDSIDFSYRIVAKRRGLETQRLVDVTDTLKAEMKAAQPKARLRTTGDATKSTSTR